MVSVGYKLSSEEHGPADLVRYARLAEEMGFSFALISDHYHRGRTNWVRARSRGASSAPSRR